MLKSKKRKNPTSSIKPEVANSYKTHRNAIAATMATTSNKYQLSLIDPRNGIVL